MTEFPKDGDNFTGAVPIETHPAFGPVEMAVLYWKRRGYPNGLIASKVGTDCEAVKYTCRKLRRHGFRIPADIEPVDDLDEARFRLECERAEAKWAAALSANPGG